MIAISSRILDNDVFIDLHLTGVNRLRLKNQVVVLHFVIIDT